MFRDQTVGRAVRWATRYPGHARRVRRLPLPDGCRSVDFVHVRKTAGTSLYNAFLGLGGEDPRVVFARLRKEQGVTASGPYVFALNRTSRRVRVTPHYFGFSHKPAWQVDLGPRSYAVTMLRDPAARCISLYRYLADPTSDAGEPNPAQPHERAWATDGFAAFLERAPQQVLLGQVAMFSRALDPAEAAERVRGFRTWFFTESYDDGMQALSDRLDIALPARRDRVSGGRQQDTLTPAELEQLDHVLAVETDFVHRLQRDPGPGFAGAFPAPRDSG